MYETKKLIFQGELLSGSPVDMVEGLRSLNYDPTQFDSLDGFMVWFTHSVWRFHSVGIVLEGETLDQRCGSLIDQLIENGFIEKK